MSPETKEAIWGVAYILLYFAMVLGAGFCIVGIMDALSKQ